MFLLVLLFLHTSLCQGYQSSICQHPQGVADEVYREGCIKYTCKASGQNDVSGIWRASIDDSVCCFNGEAFPFSSTITTISSDDGCVTTSLECTQQGINTLIRNSCSPPASKSQVTEIKHLLQQQLSKTEQSACTSNSSSNTSEQQDSKALLIGPGFGYDEKYNNIPPKLVVRSLPDMTPLNCTIPIIPERAAAGKRTMYYGYVGRYTSEGLHLCGGRINGKESSSCYLLTTTGLKDMPGLLNKRDDAASIMTPQGWWVTGGSYDDSYEYYYPYHATTELWSNNQWQEHVRLPHQMHNHCMTWVNQSHILLTGGYNRGGDYSAASYLYSEETGFTRIENMKRPRSSHGCSAINESVVFLAGGYSRPTQNTFTEYLDLATLTWHDGPQLPEHVETASMTGDILVGGKKKIFKLEQQGLSVAEWQWVEVGELNDSIKDFQAFVIDEKFCN